MPPIEAREAVGEDVGVEAAGGADAIVQLGPSSMIIPPLLLLEKGPGHAKTSGCLAIFALGVLPYSHARVMNMSTLALAMEEASSSFEGRMQVAAEWFLPLQQMLRLASR